MTMRTALLEARLPLPATTPCSTSLTDALPERGRRAERRAKFIAAKLAERDERHSRRRRESRYLVEPNVKERKGRPARSADPVLDRQILTASAPIEALVDAGVSSRARNTRLFLTLPRTSCGRCAATCIS